MWLRLRQIALVAAELDPVVDALCKTLGIAVCYRDPGVAQFGLHNALMPVGNQFLEVVAPTEEGTAGGRYLERRGGDGGYMVITQCDDHPPRRRRAEQLGLREAFSFNVPGRFVNMQLHPKDTGGSFFEIDQQLGEGAELIDGPWHPAGPSWKRARDLSRVTGIKAAELQADDPEALAARWAGMAELPVTEVAGYPTVSLDNADLRFVPCRDGRPEGLAGLDLAAADRQAVEQAAKAEGTYIEDEPRSDDGVYGPRIEVGGMRIRLVEP